MEVKERIRQSILKEHNELLEPNDPILMFLTLNDQLLSHYSEKFEELLERKEQERVGNAVSELNDASRMSTELVEKAGQYVADTMKEGADQAKRDIIQAGEQQLKVLKAESQRITDASKASRFGAYFIYGAAGLILGYLLHTFVH